MKKFQIALVLILVALMSLTFDVYAEDAATPPIAKGVINTVTYVRWGKSEMYPIIQLLGPGTEFDVYEYDEDWVLVLCDTYISIGERTQAHSFYGYVKRSDITCDPPLEGEKSEKADTGPGKRKGKRPKTKPVDPNAPTVVPSSEPEATQPPEEEEPPIEDEEYDWIIRTPGLCYVNVEYQEATFKCSFALMAQKFGGYAASSDPIYNNTLRNPYGATAFFGMESSTQDILEKMGATEYLFGSGGVKIVGETARAQFYIDTKSEDFALANFSLTLNAQATFGAKVSDGNITADTGETNIQSPFPLSVQLKKVGNGYKFILLGIKPGGGDLEFPAVLEKTFSDPDKYDKEAREADKMRKKAEELRKKVLEKIKEQMRKEQEEREKAQGESEKQGTDPLTVPDENGEDITLAPLEPVDDNGEGNVSDELPLAPLEPVGDTGEGNVSDDELPLAHLVPIQGDEVSNFPSLP